MSSEYPRFYAQCGHTIGRCTASADSSDPSNIPQDLINGQCPNCPDPPSSVTESTIEPLPTAPIVSYVRSIRGRAQKMMGSLKSTSGDNARNMEERSSIQTVSIASMTSSTALEEEIVGKENVNHKPSLVDKFNGVTVTSGTTNVIAAKQSGNGEDSTEGIMEAEAARVKILGLVAHITTNFDTMRNKIDTANRRIADIDNFKLADFMCQGVDRWTAAVKQAIQECEDDLVRECKELAKTPSGSSAV